MNMNAFFAWCFRAAAIGCLSVIFSARAQQSPVLPKAVIDGTGPGWYALGNEHFVNVNCEPDTWTWTNGMVHCTGKPIGVIRTIKLHTNFELVAQWRHLQSGGNSGIFVWATPESIKALEQGKGRLPTGDVFPTGSTTMEPFPPTSPDGKRSFPRKNLSKGVGEWNHYYVRAINGEIRLWVNGEEVSGGTHVRPATGYLCLESEGAPVEFKELRIRELP